MPLQIYIVTESIRELSESDQVIALAKIRIELEKVLTRLARISAIDVRRPNLGSIVRDLSSHEVISQQTGKSLSEVISICNRAIHGESISEESASTLIELGIDLLEDIYWEIKEQIVSGTIKSEEIITPEETNDYYEKKRYILTTVIPLVENPKKLVREVTQEQLANYLENYNEYAEFIVQIEEIKNNG